MDDWTEGLGETNTILDNWRRHSRWIDLVGPNNIM